jgi:hypothetical protein
MSQQQRDDVTIEPLPREPAFKKARRYALALFLAFILAAVLVVVASVVGVALAPLFERDDASLLPASPAPKSNPELSP